MEDNILEFDKAQLDAVFQKASRYVVGVKLKEQDHVAGIIIGMTEAHCVVAAHTEVMSSEPELVRYASKHESKVVLVEKLSSMVTILYALREEGEPAIPNVKYNAAEQLALHEKVVTFFPYKGGIAMFKGHVVLEDCTSADPTSVLYFALTCPYGSVHRVRNKCERQKMLRMSLGAPVFDLGGKLLGIVSDCGETYKQKFALKAFYLFRLVKKWYRGELKEEDEQDEKTSSRIDKEGEKEKEKEDDDDNDDQYSVDVAHYLMGKYDDTLTIDRETHRLAVVNMDWDHIKAVDLYMVMTSCLKGGRVLSVSIYPSEFGLKCMDIETTQGPSTLIGADSDVDDGGEDDINDDGKEDSDLDSKTENNKLRTYALNRQRYYYAVVVCDSSAAARHLYTTLDGTGFLKTAIMFDLRFIPDSMELKHPARDVATEEKRKARKKSSKNDEVKPMKKQKVKAKGKGKDKPQEEHSEPEATKEELELLVAAGQDAANGAKGFNIKHRSKKGKKGKDSAEDKFAEIDLSKDEMVSCMFTSQLHALDPTDPQYKRSVTLVRKQTGKKGAHVGTLDSEPPVKESSPPDDASPKKSNWKRTKNLQVLSAVGSPKRNLTEFRKARKSH